MCIAILGFRFTTLHVEFDTWKYNLKVKIRGGRREISFSDSNHGKDPSMCSYSSLKIYFHFETTAKNAKETLNRVLCFRLQPETPGGSESPLSSKVILEQALRFCAANFENSKKLSAMVSCFEYFRFQSYFAQAVTQISNFENYTL